MANSDWYPQRLADRVAWHANFSTQAGISGLANGLTAGQVIVIAADAAEVAAQVNYTEAVDAFSQAFTEFRDIALEGAIGPMPPPPAAPATYVPTAGNSGIEARTRQLAAQIRATATYTPEIGELYGLIAPAAPPVGVPSMVPTALTASQVRLAVSKAGYSVVAIDSRRGGGAWEQIGICMTAEFIDSRAPLVAAAPEVREYRCQGMQNNARVGAISGIVSAVTSP